MECKNSVYEFSHKDHAFVVLSRNIQTQSKTDLFICFLLEIFKFHILHFVIHLVLVLIHRMGYVSSLNF